MLYVRKRTVSIEHPKHMLKLMGKKTHKIFVYLNLCNYNELTYCMENSEDLGIMFPIEFNLFYTILIG